MTDDCSDQDKLLTDAQVKHPRRRNLRIMSWVFVVTFFLGVLDLVIMGWWERALEMRGQPTTIVGVFGILGAFVSLAPMMIAAWRIDKFRMYCPLCDADITNAEGVVLATRCCNHCQQRIVQGGRTHSAKVYQRYSSYRLTRLLRRCLWVIPAVCMLALVQSSYDPQMAKRVHENLILCSVLGIVGCTWKFARTRDRRCWLPMIGVLIAWIALYVSRQQGLILADLARSSAAFILCGFERLSN